MSWPTSHDAEDVNLLMTDESRERHVPAEPPTKSELGTKAAEGAGIGGTIGGAVGAVLAALATTAAISIPGVGLIAAGPIAAGLAGAGAGGLAGTIVGALVGAGIPEERARLQGEALRRGGIVLGVPPRSEGDAGPVEREWTSHRGEHLYR
jgi:hypothetical protein